jgi:hypothetical protein
MFTKGRVFALAATAIGFVAVGAPMASAACITNNDVGSTGVGLINVSGNQINPTICGNTIQVPVNVLSIPAQIPVLNIASPSSTDSSAGKSSC